MQCVMSTGYDVSLSQHSEISVATPRKPALGKKRSVCARTKSSPAEHEDRIALSPACCGIAVAMVRNPQLLQILVPHSILILTV